MKGTLYVNKKGQNMYTISPAGIHASIVFQVSYPTAESTATSPFVFVQDASHKQTLLSTEDVRITAQFYSLLTDILDAINGNLVPEEHLEQFLVDNLGMKVVRR